MFCLITKQLKIFFGSFDILALDNFAYNVPVGYTILSCLQEDFMEGEEVSAPAKADLEIA